ncbi:glycoside hydrolase family 3 C-terminal domain-containing protein [Sphingomonas oligoaromativorans]|uniref:glycoside hydrolase family 3 C-terminal domain-containing protein n=1 Tax=Sphingomonas oligoaromativorans TaxID=575322 RepID=UPI001FBA0ED8|nr:glycoside hydrolase family 3 C-terminal domain-containing protein [Sphingomonas oligoaromativorans]NIJ32227.1 beta-glucosidase [Sphingomonas oligoaromativorans]
MATLLLCAVAAIPLSMADAASPSAPPTADAADSRASILARTLVARMTLDEKIGQLLNVAPAIPRLGIPAYNWWTESLHGAIGAVPTTNYPEPIGLAATFDAPLVNRVAAGISTEVRALHTLGRETGHLGHIGTGLDTWSPNINIFRDPRWGRGQETYGEDPYLTATLGVAFIRGIQGPDPERPDVIATPKHFAVHSGPEPSRHRANVFVSAHDLEDTYLPAFRAAIVDGKAGSIMCAYNRVDGQPACGSDLLLRQHLRGAWGFKGYVVSDCDAVVDISEHHKYATDPAAGVAVALKAGVDNECNTATLTDTPHLGDRYREALTRGLISVSDIDRALIRLFAARYRNGDLTGLPGRTPQNVPVSAIGTADHQALALKSAIESLVLLKNDGILPLKSSARIAVVGPLADATRVLRGNYSSALSAPPVSVIEGMRKNMPDASIALVPFGASITDGDPVPGDALVDPNGKPGLQAEYFNGHAASQKGGEVVYDPQPIVTRTERDIYSDAPQLKQVADQNKVVWTGFLVPPESGTYRIAIAGMKGALSVDGKPAVSTQSYSRWAEPLKFTEVHLEKGRRYPLRFEAESGLSAAPGLFWKHISTNPDGDLAVGVANADVVVAVVGLTSDLEGEEMPVKVDGFSGGDKTSLELPADQRAMLEKVRALGKPLIVVTMNGSPIDLGWAKDHASAILEAWYPGQAGGLAIGHVLSGKNDPGGRLPLTFYRSLADLPPFDDYAMKGRTYRYFTGTPVYPFGYGLSYTHFEYAPLVVEPARGGAANGLHVTTEIRNTGDRAGEDVAQLYLNFPAMDGAPRVALRGFQRVALEPGERRTIHFDLSPRDLSAVTSDGVREVMAGNYRVSVGSGQPDTGVPVQSAHFSARQSAPLPQ